jgi:hypothetical protein
MNAARLDNEKLACAEAIRQHLQTAKTFRQQASEVPSDARKRLLLREWQAARLARSYADLLASDRFGRAARFFLTDLYGPKDFSHRDEEIERILPLLINLLPLSALQTITLAIEVDALTEQLDAAMVDELERNGTIYCIDDDAYAVAYRSVGRQEDRERQIVLIRATGVALQDLSRKPFLATLLRLMRGPAHLAGLDDLQKLLENGFDAFRYMGDAKEFLDCIESRERKLFRSMFCGAAQPFAL